MDVGQRIEDALETSLRRTINPGAPPGLAAAMRHAVFPGGARVRPRLALAVAEACGGDQPALADAAAAAIELLHCASLVHDDLPFFDDAETRRGRPSVHAVYGAPLALLAGDALIVQAFDTLAEVALASPATRFAAILSTVTRSVGMPAGIVAGQAWESEKDAPPAHYRRLKTGALFVAATRCGALASGGDPGLWSALGEKLGEAYQVADDLYDAAAALEDAGDKPLGQDAAHGRPNAVAQFGIEGAVAHLQGLIRDAMDSVPPCRGASDLRELVRLQALRLAPKRFQRSAA
jgi:geranylgeranyl diphosphate synthase type II